MTGAISFTVKDICQALGGICRSRVHAWTRLPPFSLIETSERSARRFNVADLLTMATLQKLEDIYGIKSRELSKLSAGIHRYLIEPKVIGTDDLVFIRLKDGSVYSLPSTTISEPGLVLDLAEERERISVFLGVAPPQRQLALVGSMSAKIR
ncbi:DNA-binding protein [Pseudomonas sp. Sample_20]|uniref:DNA-binding protein n=1 Tax=Pseudomonas sp. Sample_20 TaxID=2448264 RepID=UPI001032F758|nr:DNA-binding protein [Pseudomonas sp. Sample_20]